MEVKKQMKKTLAILALTLTFIVAIGVMPALATPVEKVSFTAVITGYRPQPPQTDEYRKIITPNGDTVHIINQIGAGTIKIWIGTTATTGTPTYQGTWTTAFKLNLNTKTSEGPVQYQMIWTIPGYGTFEGNILGTMVAPLPTDNALTGLHGIMQGSDSFDGQKLMIEDGSRATGQPTTYVGTFMK
jgi:hypothetical protein